MPKPKQLTTFAEATVRKHYGARSLQWIGGRMGCSPATVLRYARRLRLRKPTTGEKGGTATVPTVVSPDAIRPFILPPTRAQLMAGSANPRRVYKIED